MMKKFVLVVFLLQTVFCVMGQDPGQTPGTAFPVCGTSVFEQKQVPQYVSHNLIVPGCSGTGTANYQDLNPFWYKFTCFKGGTLAFKIRPKNMSDDYDWQLYDITGRDPDDVFTTNATTASSLIQVANWCATPGETGASSSGTNKIECASIPEQGINAFSPMPTLIEGHTYILLVSHYTSTNQSGYDLSFTGGTAVITDTTQPALKSMRTNCAYDELHIKLNKKMSCSSLAANGSDFILNTSLAKIVSAAGVGCNGGFDMDSLILKLDIPLPVGSYTVSTKNGTDGNTLLDFCQTPIPEGNSLSFTVRPKEPTPMDSLVPPKCAPQTLSIVFDKGIKCSSIASDFSDFKITGNYPVTIQSVNTNCDANGNTRQIDIVLSKPLQQESDFQLILKRGTDNNTIIDECNEITPPDTLYFSVKDTVSAQFTYNINYGCEQDVIDFYHPGNNGIDAWNWMLDEKQHSTLQNPQGVYKVFNEKNIQCIVSNGFCSDTTSQKILLDNYLSVDFDVPPDNCPLEDILFTDKSIGKNITRHWSFGDNAISIDTNPVHVYKRAPQTSDYSVRYTVTDEYGCSKSVEKKIKVYVSCIIDIPNAFTPNNDGVNDILYPLNAVKAINLNFKVFNRWGQQLFSTNNWKHGWDGTFAGQLQSPGMYVWMLSYEDRDSKKHFFKKGVVMLLR